MYYKLKGGCGNPGGIFTEALEKSALAHKKIYERGFSWQGRKLFLFSLFFVIVLPVFSQNKPKLAILPFTGGRTGDGETIAELLSFQPDIANAFVVLPRTSNVNSIMAEQHFQRSSGLTDSDTIAALGKRHNADYVVAGHIQTLGASNLILCTIVNVETFQQIAGDFREYKTIEQVQNILPDMAKKMIQASRISASNMPKLAILPFNIPEGVNAGDAEVLAQLLAAEIANSGKYAVLPRTKTIETVMREQRIQRSGMTDPNSIKAIGKATNAQFVLSGNVRSLGSTNMFTVSILNIEDGSLVAGNAKNYKTIADGLSLMGELCLALTGTRAGGGNIPEYFIRVEGGTFSMGSGNGDNDERPIHTVQIGSFYISKTEVTQREYQQIMGNNPSSFKGDNLPVDSVSWFDAITYCNKLSQLEGLTPAYRGSRNAISCDFSANGYRLPTEAEWEFAARGGSRENLAHEYAGGNRVDSVAWHSGNSGKKTHPVATKTPNALGLYDMSGNVLEWCWDWYGNYSAASQVDPRGLSMSTLRVCRGGSYNDGTAEQRIANRDNGTPASRYNNLGFRVVRSF